MSEDSKPLPPPDSPAAAAVLPPPPPPPAITMEYSPHSIISILVFLSSITGGFSSGAVTLVTIQIFNTHEWVAPKPSVYFYCQGENKIILPDVKEKGFLYNFKGEESWQPLTELPDEKCKRCGLYEMDTFKSDDVFDEWELCSDDFDHGIYVHYKEKEFNATFTIPEYGAAAISAERKLNIFLMVIISTLVSVLVTVGIVSLYKYWKKRKRQLDQARFLKLFQDPDDLDELDNF